MEVDTDKSIFYNNLDLDHTRLTEATSFPCPGYHYSVFPGEPFVASSNKFEFSDVFSIFKGMTTIPKKTPKGTFEMTVVSLNHRKSAPSKSSLASTIKVGRRLMKNKKFVRFDGKNISDEVSMDSFKESSTAMKQKEKLQEKQILTLTPLDDDIDDPEDHPSILDVENKDNLSDSINNWDTAKMLSMPIKNSPNYYFDANLNKTNSLKYSNATTASESRSGTHQKFNSEMLQESSSSAFLSSSHFDSKQFTFNEHSKVDDMLMEETLNDEMNREISCVGASTVTDSHINLVRSNMMASSTSTLPFVYNNNSQNNNNGDFNNYDNQYCFMAPHQQYDQQLLHLSGISYDGEEITNNEDPVTIKHNSHIRAVQMTHQESTANKDSYFLKMLESSCIESDSLSERSKDVQTHSFNQQQMIGSISSSAIKCSPPISSMMMMMSHHHHSTLKTPFSNNQSPVPRFMRPTSSSNAREAACRSKIDAIAKNCVNKPALPFKTSRSFASLDNNNSARDYIDLGSNLNSGNINLQKQQQQQNKLLSTLTSPKLSSRINRGMHNYSPESASDHDHAAPFSSLNTQQKSFKIADDNKVHFKNKLSPPFRASQIFLPGSGAVSSSAGFSPSFRASNPAKALSTCNSQQSSSIFEAPSKSSTLDNDKIMKFVVKKRLQQHSKNPSFSSTNASVASFAFSKNNDSFQNFQSKNTSKSSIPVSTNSALHSSSSASVLKELNRLPDEAKQYLITRGVNVDVERTNFTESLSSSNNNTKSSKRRLGLSLSASLGALDLMNILSNGGGDSTSNKLNSSGTATKPWLGDKKRLSHQETSNLLQRLYSSSSTSELQEPKNSSVANLRSPLKKTASISNNASPSSHCFSHRTLNEPRTSLPSRSSVDPERLKILATPKHRVIPPLMMPSSPATSTRGILLSSLSSSNLLNNTSNGEGARFISGAARRVGGLLTGISPSKQISVGAIIGMQSARCSSSFGIANASHSQKKL